MSIVVAEKLTTFPDGEWVPGVPRAIREALRSNSDALALWTEAQSKPAGWSMGNRERMAADMGWTHYRVRRAIAGLRRVGLYLVERIQDAAGRWSTACRFVASLVASPQVTPKAGLPEVGISDGIPPLRESKRERHAPRRPRLARPHDPATCPREAANQPCRDCAAAAAARQPEKPSAATHPAPAPVDAVIAAALGATGTECEHGHLPGRCGQCRYAAAHR